MDGPRDRQDRLTCAKQKLYVLSSSKGSIIKEYGSIKMTQIHQEKLTKQLICHQSVI